MEKMRIPIVCPPKVKVSNFSWDPQGRAVIFSHHQVCIKEKKGGHFLIRIRNVYT
jgi:hypothetical protein